MKEDEEDSTEVDIEPEENDQEKEEEEEEEWRRVNGRLKRLPNSSTSTVGEKVLV